MPVSLFKLITHLLGHLIQRILKLSFTKRFALFELSELNSVMHIMLFVRCNSDISLSLSKNLR